MKAVNSEIVFKAVSPDNGLHVKRIVELFRRAYGEDFPVRQVYTPEFWRSRIGNRLTSFVAERDGKFVGHLAACPDRENSKHVQICVPAFDPELGSETTQVAKQLWEMIERVAQRQDWKAAYKFLISSLPEVEQLVSKVFGFTDIAIYPGCTVPRAAMRTKASKNGSKGHANYRLHPPVLVTERTFLHESENDITVYAPAQHAEIIKFLYEPLKLSRQFCAGTEKDNNTPILSADSQALEVSSFPHSGIAHLFIQPSLLQGFSSSIFDFSGHQFDDYIVFANLFDSQTPQFCNFLEDQGLRFCGIVPLLNGRDNVVYAHTGSGLLEKASFSSKRAQKLVKYIEEYVVPTKTQAGKKKIVGKSITTGTQTSTNDR